ncbi:hypothetical protein [Kaistella yonginensis]|uniref:hypothetical protein n=1 Tax=Kaistella yonginensis TaxID=658267 RepID=UPI0025B2B303|nr:hypothetical protein [Kaistella yonginensis]MDN3605305.1 hypothetical protein [Kaistella yonginensis]
MNNISKILKNFLAATFLIFYGNILHANATQPGIWSAGGTTFTMLYPEDSATFKKVQMQSEQIFIQLYKGFAVVKGVYFFKNHSNEKLNFKMGYPVNGIYSGGAQSLNQINIDSLSAFKIYADQIPLAVLKEPQEEYVGNFQSFSDNWKVWEMTFEPNQIKKVEVFFIVSTNDGSVSRGYNKEHYNAFLYLLESGSVWKNPIEKGSFYIQLRDGLSEKDIHGLSDSFNFQYNAANKVFSGFKNNFSPTPTDNLAVTYLERLELFDFTTILKNQKNYETVMEEFSKMALSKLVYEKFEAQNPYEISSSLLSYLPAAIMFVVFGLPWILLGLIVIFVGYFFYKKIKKK